MEEQEKIVESPNSVKFGINAKGMWSGEVKVYAPTIDEALSEAVRVAKEIEVIIQTKNGGVK